ELPFMFLNNKNNDKSDKYLVWIASELSDTNFNDINVNLYKMNQMEKNISGSNVTVGIDSPITAITGNNSNSNKSGNSHINCLRINCYDTKPITYTNKKIKKNAIVCFMSNSAISSFYKNFGFNFDYAVCMGKTCFQLLKDLKFQKQILFPSNSTLESFLKILINLYNKLK
ncbi:conserved protein, unknown function, partial [Hepatocystis sp. ex Piliocolobus tephrosceles]